MSNYGVLERNVARLLERVPTIKRFAKHCYSKLVYVRAKKNFKYNTTNELTAYTKGRRSSFFGYYDKTPQSVSGHVLVQTTSQSTRERPSRYQEVELNVFSNKMSAILGVPVKSYNWQQGCRAHWLTSDLFIFNDFDDLNSNYISRIYSVKYGKEVKSFPYPVQDSFENKFFISLNYQRLMCLRPDYGYRNLPPLSSNEIADLDSDGLWKVDIESGHSELFITISDACDVKQIDSVEKAIHKFNHVLVSPSGDDFIFMHRFLIGERRFDRLLLADSTTGKLTLLSDYGMVSHCCWVDSNTILGYLRGPGGKDGYWFVDVKTGAFKPCLQEKLSKYGDGHPHVCGDWFVTDTYPDRARMQHLLLCNWKTGEVKELGEFFHGFEFQGESRCDLHPRFSPDGRAVYFDSVFSGQRQLYRMELSN